MSDTLPYTTSKKNDNGMNEKTTLAFSMAIYFLIVAATIFPRRNDLCCI